MDYLKAIILALVEGITEFLPISSTGHLILVGDFIAMDQPETFLHAFDVLIQLPAILAVALYFWTDLWPGRETGDWRPTALLWSKIALAFLPAAVAGVLFHDDIKALLQPVPVAVALIVGGLALVLIERRKHRGSIETVAEIGFGLALAIGCFQCLALFPGTSRSAATIIGALLLGATRPVAAEFSFFLAIPTMAGASAYTVYQEGLSFSGQQWGLVAIASLVSFFVAYAVIAFLMRFIRTHSFTVFGYYRLALGSIVLLFAL